MRFAFLAVFSAVFALWGCLEADDARVSVRVVLEEKKDHLPASDVRWFVQVQLEGADLERPLTAGTWGSGSEGALLELRTTAGGPRRLSAVLFVFTTETVRTWAGSRPDLYLAAGDQTVEITLLAQPEYTLQGEILLDSPQPAQAWMEDLATKVAFPATHTTPLADGLHGIYFPGLPQGRFLRLTVQDASGTRRSFDDCPLRAHTDRSLFFSGDFATGSCQVLQP